jgi:lipid A ethanolaminephosphotransferase
MGFDTSCMRRNSGQSMSHDNLFHTVLGMMDVVTKIYDPSLDAFAACRRMQEGA